MRGMLICNELKLISFYYNNIDQFSRVVYHPYDVWGITPLSGFGRWLNAEWLTVV
jgi:hypothetical protein